MLAYVFWHRPRPEVDPRAYEQSLLDFQAGLREVRPAGLVEAATLRIGPAPWTGGEPAYEDWYLVDGFGSLGTLTEGAVSASVAERHDTAARLAGWGAGGLYAPRTGPPILPTAAASWLAKPDGMPYADLDRLLAPVLGPAATLWQRQLVLGPAPEFCLAGPAPHEHLPALPHAVGVRRSVLHRG